MKTIARLLIPCLLTAVIAFESCQKNIADNINQPHQVTVYLTDHQTPVFDSVFIDLQGLDVKLEDDTLSNGGWVSLSIHPGVYNILKFRNGLDTLFASGTLPNARLHKIRLRLGTQNSVMKNGVSTPLKIKNEDREVIMNLDASNFEINNGQVLFWIDFDAGSSIQPDNSGQGNNNGYRLKSHISVFTHSHTGRIEGIVLPLNADPIIKAYSGTDTAMAIPDDSNGKYKIVGLRAGIYNILIDGQNGFNDTTITNVVVRSGEDTHMSQVILH